ncbi:MAG: cobyric acid synthase [Nitrospirae bacterium]|nr:MAG: cobyric acid synthase [Nitrospirota bacterium]
MALPAPTSCRALMFQGTASNVGKSVLATAFCRILRDQGRRVAPFKAQNWTLNPFVTPSGSEIGWSQAVQAEACGVYPNTHMNPLLLKPVEGNRVELLIQGEPYGILTVEELRRLRSRLERAVRESYAFLAREYDTVVIEGAGTPTDIETRAVHLANAGVAEIADAPVILVGDASKGGVFAALYGTLALLPEAERERVKGILINRFQGDRTDGATLAAHIEQRCGVPVLGLIPELRDLILPHEGRVLVEERPAETPPVTVRIGVVDLPHVGNDDDAAPLAVEPAVELVEVGPEAELEGLHCVLLPGSANTLEDLAFLHETGLARRIRAFRNAGGMVVGIGGGLQMLGKVVLDPLGRESNRGEVEGLGLLPIATLLGHTRESHEVEAICLEHTEELCGKSVHGYENHYGRTLLEEEVQPFAAIVRRDRELIDHRDGAISEDGRVWGTYIHGLFDDPAFRRCFLRRLRAQAGQPPADTPDPHQQREASIARVTQAVHDYVDVERILGWL